MADHREYLIPPFTNREVLQALALVMPADGVEAIRSEAMPALDAPCTASMPVSTLLLLATISEEFAGRIVEHRPDLRDDVARVRRDPAAYVEAHRMPGPDGETS